MNNEVINTSKAPAAIGPYSQAVATGHLVFVSGQLPIDPAEGKIVATDVKGQTEQALKNATAILEEAGLTLNDAVFVTVLLDNIQDFQAMNEVYDAFFKEPYPARMAYEVGNLPSGALVEIQIVAQKA